jgi:hypothetical protein
MSTDAEPAQPFPIIIMIIETGSVSRFGPGPERRGIGVPGGGRPEILWAVKSVILAAGPLYSASTASAVDAGLTLAAASQLHLT